MRCIMMDHKKVLFFKLIFGAKLAPQKFLDGLSKLGIIISYLLLLWVWLKLRLATSFEDDFVDRPFQWFST